MSERLLGELKGILESHGKMLSEIRSDVKAQNGRVRKLEQDAVRIKAYWSSGALVVAIFGGWLKSKLGL